MEEKKKPPRQCKKLGRELTGKEREERGLSHARRWRMCLQTVPPHGAAVCLCHEKCGPKCSGYE